jgi:hypothetical protein
MRATFVAFCFTVCALSATAQNQTEDKKAGDSQQGTGSTVSPDDNKGQLQPQGWTGPITTGTGGTSATSPQGDSPPGMQPVPDNVPKTTGDRQPDPPK